MTCADLCVTGAPADREEPVVDALSRLRRTATAAAACAAIATGTVIGVVATAAPAAAATSWTTGVCKVADTTKVTVLVDVQNLDNPLTAPVVRCVSGRSYTESCRRTPPAAAYWNYWQAANGGAWSYSNYGAATAKVKLGGFEGWSFSLDKTASTNPQPRFTPKRVG